MMTSRRAQKRNPNSKHAARAALAVPVTDEERQALERMRAEGQYPGSTLFTSPGCDLPAHRAHIQSVMMAQMSGQPAGDPGIYRMRCGCALLVDDEPFDIDLDAGMAGGMVTARFEKMGAWALPIPFLQWLDDHGLVQTFDDYAAARRDAGTHGDAITPFMVEHGAQQDDIDEVMAILSG